MLKLLFLLISSLLVWSSARVLDSREYSFSQLSICGVSEAQLSPGAVLDIKSPNFDYGSYSINTRCQVTLKSGPENLLLTFDFLNIDIELEVGACSWDSLCINGVKLCGVWAQGSVFQYILPANSDFTLDFKTDYVVNRRGFDILVSASLYNNETVNITYGGVGTSREALQSQLLTLENLNYQDRCGLQSETSTGYPGAPWTNETTAYYQYTSSYPWYYDSSSYYQYSTYYPWNYDSTSYYQYTTYYPSNYDSTSYYQYTTNYPWYYDSTSYYQYTTYYPWYYDSTSYYQYTTNNPWYYDSSSYYQYTTNYPWNYDSTSYYQYTTNYPWYYDSTSYYQYTTNYPWYYDSTSYYQYTTNYPWYYDSSSYYQYSTSYPYYYETSTYNPYSTYYPYTTGNPYYNPYTPVASAFPSKDYVASLVQQVIQQLNSERYSQEQASLLLTQLLRYLGY
ncbi:uncharacterized protein LOC129921985 [Biomphalaria glabrata]|uniref:Uncharacterized protein LOC129921985 n=1 Tax=Biomphalaria glabrata TaxID=6526 RepID=A0A9W2YFQ4_BIOGL|nr:uncharacterized protein LOC129921985 [Biomphalaria glabrata]